ncbi:MAG: CRISPR-associated endonuclease Cas2 [Patescibacteria group bacterium]
MKNIPQTKSLLHKIAELIGRGLIISVEMRRYQKIYLSGGGHEQVKFIKRALEQQQWRKKIKELRRSGYLKTKRIGARLQLKLTDKAQLLLLLESIKHAPTCINGYSTLVIFDVPEQAKRVRQTLRRFLQDAGFSQLQKSVWLHPHNVVQPLQAFLSAASCGQWVRVFQAQVVQ